MNYVGYVKKTSGNRKFSLETGLPTYIGECCRYCGKKERHTRRACCVMCYTETGVARSLDKRKHQLVRRLKSQATFKNIEFNITEDDLEWNLACPILGIDLDYFSLGGSRGNTVSFDRKDPKKGYVKGNVFIISNRANMIKSDMTKQQLERMVNYVNR